ncbi:kinesin-like protein KIN-UA isoform X1 [Zea mays]|uniref:Kinesin-like protein n=3 Tax=Zea mays TaxID=4577 RepID=A0A1D6JNZ4_MAIZE|nr:kinesin-like protein KIN-UA isoform X1 [Zea mays]ONL93747.1 Armadillo/beta-catenin repeat family protein / kinesin motor family protein [Zea mays]|eukprot:XP_008651147.1 kinesin-like protein KIN-UA isoform X1 [Zea mays]
MATGAGWAPGRPVERHGAPRGGNARSKSVVPGPRRPSPSPARSRPAADHSGSADLCRVRVAVRLRPKNSEDLAHGADFDSCVELQPESKRLKLKKNNWSCESYKFDEVFSESASQKRVYEAVAKPVVESVLEGYNGTVMAYGQTGTGKTYTVGRLGKDDPSERGIMVRALEHILSSLSFETDCVAISYLQLYLESVHDLLAPEKTNIPIVEDAKTGEVSLPGAAIVEVKDLEHVFQLLQIGEANRHAANTKMNTESSRSHAILIIHLQRNTRTKEENGSSLYDVRHDTFPDDLPLVLKSKLLIVDLAGSERIDKSGSEGHMIEEAKFINLSLTSLGKCINALAENSSHVPTRDSKLTRILRDSFGGTARTSLVVTIGPSARHYSETSSTIMFGQRAMKVVNTIKLKEEVDYEILYKKMEREVDQLTSEMERQQKVIRSEKMQMDKRLKESERSFHDLRMTFNMQIENLEKENRHLESSVKRLTQDLDKERGQNNLLSKQVTELEKLLDENKQQQLENLSKTKIITDEFKEYEKEMGELVRKLEEERCCSSSMKDRMSLLQQQLCDAQSSAQLQESMARELEKELTKATEEFTIEIQSLKGKISGLISEKESIYDELKSTQEKVQLEMSQRKGLEDQILRFKQSVSDSCAEESKTSCSMVRSGSGLGNTAFVSKSEKLREALSGQRGTISKIFEEVGLPNVLALLKSEDLDVQIHAVKVVANLAAEDVNQERIVEEGGLDALLSLLETSENTTIHRVTAGAVANLAMNGSNQGVIMNKGGARLLANVASETDDPQTLRMVAGAIANLCGNEKLHLMLKQDGGIKALLGMFRSGHADVIAQIARGIANFAKCESRMISQGHRKGRSLLIEDGVLSWMVAHSTMFSASTRRHIELAFCHLAQNEDNTCDIIASGGIKELLRISRESPREDTRNLAKKALDSNPAFLREIQ